MDHAASAVPTPAVKMLHGGFSPGNFASGSNVSSVARRSLSDLACLLLTRRSNLRPARTFLVILFCLNFLPSTAFAAGLRNIVIPATAGAPQISAQIWTPCAAPPGPIRVESGGVQLTLTGVKDCA